ncbi:MAG: hypothetical protein HYS27_27130 [Deltaproteobacteria bacterium]|nr:hypothetical protein [Deltaproteobacteria bacterium]
MSDVIHCHCGALASWAAEQGTPITVDGGRIYGLAFHRADGSVRRVQLLTFCPACGDALPPTAGAQSNHTGEQVCSFCGRTNMMDRKMVAGKSSVLICDSCVFAALDIIRG